VLIRYNRYNINAFLSLDQQGFLVAAFYWVFYEEIKVYDILIMSCLDAFMVSGLKTLHV
jgi:hypothetical protein